jgi:hypothetical protein
MVYEPLDPSNPDVRLLSIEPASDNEKLVCSLTTVSLAGKPRYIAVSYVWGAPNDTTEVIINGHQVNITSNLYSLLLQCRRWAGSRTDTEGDIVPSNFWVDAICINQRDNAEKSHQVRMMGSIYSQASEVISWLGKDESNQYALAMGAIVTIAGDDTSGDFLEVIELVPWLLQADDADEILPNKTWLGVKALFEDPYWQRVWILQEVVLAQEDSLMLWAGRHTIPFYQLLHFIQIVSKCFQKATSKPDFFPSAIWVAHQKCVNSRRNCLGN